MNLFNQLWGDDIKTNTSSDKTIIPRDNYQEEILPIKSLLDSFERTLPHTLDLKNKKSVIQIFLNDKKKISHAKSHKELLKKMTKSYQLKSQKQLEYFVKNISNTYDKLNKKSMIDFNSLNNIAMYSKLRNNIAFNSNDRLTLDEKLQGDFLYNLDKKFATKKLSKIFYIQEVVKQKREPYSAYMLTFTNPSSNIFYVKKKGATLTKQGDFQHFRKNKNYDKKNGTFEESIKLGAKLQKEINRFFYKDLKQRIKRCKSKEDTELFHFTIYENTKQLHFHSHKLLLVPSQYHNEIELSFENTTKHFNLEQVKFDKLDEIKENKNKSKAQKLNSAKASSYIYKYLFKTMKCEFDTNNENLQEVFNKNIFFNIFRRYFAKEHRIFTASNYQHTTQKRLDIMYKFLKENYPQYLAELKKKGSIYYELEQLELKKFFIFKTVTRTRYSINTKKLKTRLTKLEKKYCKNLNESYDLAKVDLFEEFENDLTLFNINKKSSQYVHKQKTIILKSCYFKESFRLKNRKSGNEKLIYHHEMYALDGFTEEEFSLIY